MVKDAIVRAPPWPSRPYVRRSFRYRLLTLHIVHALAAA